MYELTLLKATNFGNNDRVWNIPSPTHSFDQYEKKVFSNVIKRLPLLATGFVLSGEYTDDLKEFDYLIVKDLDNGKLRYYFVDGITGERNIILLSLILDTFTTYNLLSTPITGTLVRKHDTNVNETPFDYPTALVCNPLYEIQKSDIVSYNIENTVDSKYFIESSVDLSSIPSAKTITSNLNKNVTIPILKKPKHQTLFEIIVGTSAEKIVNHDGGFAVYNTNLINEDTLNTLRGLAGDGAITDSYSIPFDAISIETLEDEGKPEQYYRVISNKVNKTTDLIFKNDGTFRNKAIEGMFNLEISSIASGDAKKFPSWAVKSSVNASNYFVVTLWCNPTPNGNPFCSPRDGLTNIIIPSATTGSRERIESLFNSMLVSGVKGEQWVKNPLVYSSGSGEIFASVETQLQRDKSAFELNSGMVNLEISQREKDIKIAQQRYNYEASQAMGIINIAGDLLSGDFGGAISGVGTALASKANQQYIKELQALKSYEGSKQGQLLKIAHANNLTSLNVQEKIRRIVSPELVHRENSPMKNYNVGNDFKVTILEPDAQTLKQKDMEYSLYGYPVLENVEGFIMTNNLRQNHSVFMFSECAIDIGGDIGDITREFLRNGIRILSKKYSINNLLNNPK